VSGGIIVAMDEEPKMMEELVLCQSCFFNSGLLSAAENKNSLRVLESEEDDDAGTLAAFILGESIVDFVERKEE